MIALDFEVKTYDIDFAGVVSNLVYVRWLEDLRLAYLKLAMSLDDLMERQVYPTLVHTSINYRAPVRFPDEVHGVIRLVEAGSTSLTLEATFQSRKSGQLVADARQVGLLLDAKTGRPSPVPEELRRLVVSAQT